MFGHEKSQENKEKIESKNDKQGKLLVYSGMERCDILFSISKVGNRFGKKILVIDNSIKGDFFRIFKKDITEKATSMEKIVVCRDFNYTTESLKKYDLVVLYNGETGEPLPESCDYHMVAATFDANSIEELRDLLEDSEVECETILVMREHVNNKITAKTLQKEIALERADLSYTLEYDKTDYELYCELTLNHNAPLKSCSDKMYLLLAELSQKLFGITEKQFRAIKK